MIRTFVAVEVPEHVRRMLVELGSTLKSLGLVGSYPKQDSFHLTLKFLGETAEDAVSGIGQAIEKATEGIPEFEVNLRGLGVFPGLSSPRVVWVGVQHHEYLSLLHSRVEAALAEMGYPPEDRGFKPHLTLVRLKSRENVKKLGVFLQDRGASEAPGAIPVRQVHLFRSDLRPDGARYTKLRSIALGRRVDASSVPVISSSEE